MGHGTAGGYGHDATSERGQSSERAAGEFYSGLVLCSGSLFW
jgi:hypothetical protein